MNLGNGVEVIVEPPGPSFTTAAPPARSTVVVLPVAGPQGPAGDGTGTGSGFVFDLDVYGRPIIDGGSPNNGTGA